MHQFILVSFFVTHLIAFGGASFINGIAHTFNAAATAVHDLTTSELVMSTDVRKVGFLLYPSKVDLEFYQSLEYGDSKLLKKSKYNPNLPLIVITHGFLGTTDENQFVQIVKKAYRDMNYNVNIIQTDWSALSTANTATAAAYYGSAVNNVPRVGKRLAQFLVFLKKNKMIKSGADVHLIGHSLGSHVSGMAGMHYREMTKGDVISRISGLDPAGPEFVDVKEKDDRLDPTDASFVDITHTNRGFFGYDGDLGHVDFYPNGGGRTEPDCGLDPSGICSHSDAYKYWGEALRRSIYACKCNIREENPDDCMSFCKEPIIYGEKCPFTARGEYYFKLLVPN